MKTYYRAIVYRSDAFFFRTSRLHSIEAAISAMNILNFGAEADHEAGHSEYRVALLKVTGATESHEMTVHEIMAESGAASVAAIA